MVKKHFNKLNIPTQWEQYWSKYPNGYSIMEALIDWVSQVDDMVDTQNDLSDTVETYGNRLDEFIGQYDTHLQETLEQTLSDWQVSGFLNIVINEALNTKYHEMDNRLTTQLSEKAQQSALETERERINNLTANAGDTDGNAELLDIRVGFDGVTYSTAGEATRLLGTFLIEEGQQWRVDA